MRPNRLGLCPYVRIWLWFLRLKLGIYTFWLGIFLSVLSKSHYFLLDSGYIQKNACWMLIWCCFVICTFIDSSFLCISSSLSSSLQKAYSMSTPSFDVINQSFEFLVLNSPLCFIIFKKSVYPSTSSPSESKALIIGRLLQICYAWYCYFS